MGEAAVLTSRLDLPCQGSVCLRPFGRMKPCDFHMSRSFCCTAAVSRSAACVPCLVWPTEFLQYETNFGGSDWEGVTQESCLPFFVGLRCCAVVFWLRAVGVSELARATCACSVIRGRPWRRSYAAKACNVKQVTKFKAFFKCTMYR